MPCSWLVEALERLLDDEDDEADVVLVLDDAVVVSGMLCGGGRVLNVLVADTSWSWHCIYLTPFR